MRRGAERRRAPNFTRSTLRGAARRAVFAARRAGRRFEPLVAFALIGFFATGFFALVLATIAGFFFAAGAADLPLTLAGSAFAAGLAAVAGFFTGAGSTTGTLPDATSAQRGTSRPSL